MPAVRVHVPKYCLHKSRGLAYVRDRGKVRYLGKWNSAREQRSLPAVSDRMGGPPGRRLSPLPDPGVELTVVELCAGLLDFAQGYYTKNGKPSGWLDHIRLMLRKIRETYTDALQPAPVWPAEV